MMIIFHSRIKFDGTVPQLANPNCNNFNLAVVKTFKLINKLFDILIVFSMILKQ